MAETYDPQHEAAVDLNSLEAVLDLIDEVEDQYDLDLYTRSDGAIARLRDGLDEAYILRGEGP